MFLKCARGSTCLPWTGEVIVGSPIELEKVNELHLQFFFIQYGALKCLYRTSAKNTIQGKQVSTLDHGLIHKQLYLPPSPTKSYL